MKNSITLSLETEVINILNKAMENTQRNRSNVANEILRKELLNNGK
jgi:metal-responsive CopG/Arc/MetJ family transcriptional regulator